MYRLRGIRRSEGILAAVVARAGNAVEASRLASALRAEGWTIKVSIDGGEAAVKMEKKPCG